MKAYPLEFRIAVANAYDECLSSIEVAEQFNVSESWVRRLIQRRRELGTLEPLPNHLPDNSVLDEQDFEKIRSLIEAKPDIVLGEIADALDNKVVVSSVHRAIVKLGLTRKKKRSTPASKTDRT